MSEYQWLVITLSAYMLLMIVIGLWAARRTSDQQDYFLGGRRLGPWIAALSASATSSSAWVMLGISGVAYTWGVQAVWLLPSALLGYLFTWLWAGPRLRKLTEKTGAVTLSELLFGDYESDGHNAVIRTASIIILICFVFYVAAQFQAAGLAFSSTFSLPTHLSIIVGATIVLFYTLLGGFWAVSVTDTVQAILMICVAAILPAICLVMVGGYGELFAAIRETSDAAQLSLFGPYTGILAVGFVIGMLSIGVGYHGQPHIVNRFMALRDDRSVRQGSFIAVSWMIVVFSGMLTLGLSAKILFPAAGEPEQLLFVAAREFLPPVLAGLVTAAVLSAIMSTADSQLLVAASSVSRDWNLDKSREHSDVLTSSRIVVTLVAVLASLLAMFAPQTIFERVLFAWHGVGSAFGPFVLVRLCGYRPARGYALASLITGFGLTAILHFAPDTPGDIAERAAPFLLALAIALAGIRRQA